MTDSLIVAGYETIGGTNYRLTKEYDFGGPIPDTATIASLLLDGDVIVGTRTRNRTFELHIGVTATSRAALTAAIDALLLAVNKSTFTIQWTPDGGLPVVFDCFRATASRTHDVLRDAQLWTGLVITCEALPFGRSLTPQVVSAAASQLQIDSFDTAPTGATLDTSVKYEGTGSARVTYTDVIDGTPTRFAWQAPTVSRTVSRNLSGKTSTTLLFRPPALAKNTGSASGPFSTYSATFAFVLTLTDGTNTDSYSASVTVDTASTKFGLVTFDLTAATHVTGTGVNLAAITGYTIDSKHQHNRTTPSTYYSATSYNGWYDDLRALPTSSAGIASTKAQVLTIPSILGSARAPVALAAQNAGGTLSSVLLHAPPGDQDPNAAILIDLSDSTANQTQTIAAANSGFAGTYAVILSIATLGSAGSNTVTVTVTQKESGTTVATQALTLTYTSPYTGKIIPVGEVTLPLRPIPDDNTATSYTVQVNRTAGGDLYSDLALCDTRGQTILAVSPIAAAFIYVDAPSPLVGFGPVLTTATDRTNAYSILDTSTLSGGPIQFDPGNNRLLALSPDAAPSVTATLYPRWLDERVS